MVCGVYLVMDAGSRLSFDGRELEVREDREDRENRGSERPKARAPATGGGKHTRVYVGNLSWEVSRSGFYMLRVLSISLLCRVVAYVSVM